MNCNYTANKERGNKYVRYRFRRNRGGTSIPQNVEYKEQTITSQTPWTFTFNGSPKIIFWTHKFSISPYYQYYCVWNGTSEHAYVNGNLATNTHISVNGNTVSIDAGQVSGQTWEVKIYALY